MITILFYGDSETAYYGWTNLIQQCATAANAGVNIINTAVAGQNVTWGIANEQALVAAYSPTKVVFEFSMNDAVWLTLSQAYTDTEQLVSTIERQGAQVFLATNNDPNALAVSIIPQLANVQEYFSQYRDIASQMGVGLIDNEATFGPAEIANPSLLVYGGIHPTLYADTLYEIPNEMAALGLSFPVFDIADGAMAVPKAEEVNALLYHSATGIMPNSVSALDLVTGDSESALANALVRVMQHQFLGHMTNMEELYYVDGFALGREPTAAELSQNSHETPQQILIGIAASTEAAQHAATWLATF